MIDPNVLRNPLSLDEAYDVMDSAAANELQQAENRVATGQLLQVLPADEYHVIRLLIGEEMTLRQAAKELGVSDVTVMHRRDSALTRMRSALV